MLCHSLGSLLWLHHAAGRPLVQVARVALVAPPQPDDDDPQSPGFRPVPLDREGVAAAAGETRLVCSTDDPWCPPETSRRIGRAIGAEIDWLEAAGHISADGGYGPWPALEAWALGAGGELAAPDAPSEAATGRARTNLVKRALACASHRGESRDARSAEQEPGRAGEDHDHPPDSEDVSADGART